MKCIVGFALIPRSRSKRNSHVVGPISWRAVDSRPRCVMSENLGKHPIFFCQTGIIILPGMGRHIVFKCPQTGMNVQHSLADTADDAKDAYVSVLCQACTKLHFINSSTGNLLGKAEK